MKSGEICPNLLKSFKSFQNLRNLQPRIAQFCVENETVAWKWDSILSWVGGPVILSTKHTSLIIHPTYPNPIELLYTPKKHPIKEEVH